MHDAGTTFEPSSRLSVGRAKLLDHLCLKLQSFLIIIITIIRIAKYQARTHAREITSIGMLNWIVASRPSWVAITLPEGRASADVY